MESFVTSDAFRQLFQSMSEGIIMVEESGKISAANPIAEMMFGYGKGEMRGLTIEVLLPERYRGNHVMFRQGFNAKPEPRRMGVGRELTALRKDGVEFPVEISLSYTRVDDRLFVMAFISDISLRKKADEALKRSEEQLIVYAAELEQKVKARTEALATSIARLESEIIERKKAEEEVQKSLEKERELNELKSKFVSIASHEFRTPLSTVMSSASLIQQYKDRSEFEKVDKHVQRIKSSVDHLTSILNDFLSLGRLEEGKVEFQNEKIHVPNFLDEVKEEFRSLKEGQQLSITTDPAISEIETDSRVLRHILFNLLSNASKYSAINKTIGVDCKLSGDHLVFTIMDQGIGIPKEDQKYLFDRFFRASNTGNIEGTGLGLNIVKRYVDLLNGTINFTSEDGVGSTFTVTIPLLSTRK